MSFREEVPPSSDVAKWIILLLLGTALAALIGFRLLMMPSGEPVASQTTENEATAEQDSTIMTAQPTDAPAPTQTAAPAEPVINTPQITGALIEKGQNGQVLGLSGTSDTDCNEVVVRVDGLEIGRTTPTVEGAWSLKAPAPAPGSYSAILSCVTDNGTFPAEPRMIQVPEEAIEPDVELEPTPDETVDENEMEEETAPAAESQPDFSFANNMDEWIGGPLLVRGVAEPNSQIELVFDNAVRPIVVTATVIDDGRFAVYTTLTEPGQYDVTAQYAGTRGVSTEVVVVPSDVVFGGPGNCVGTVPPFGTLRGNAYVVNNCEYFSLISQRLGINYNDLLNVNRNLADPNNLRTGDQIQIPPLP